MTRFTLVLLVLAKFTLAVDLFFASDANCTGHALYGARRIESSGCQDLSDFDHAPSVVIANLTAGQKVITFSDQACQHMTSTNIEDTCYTDSLGQIGSFRIDSAATAGETDAIAQPIRLTNYKELALMDPYHVDLRYSNAFIGVALYATASALNLYSTVKQCATISGPSPVPIVDCILGALSVAASVTAPLLFHRAGRDVNSALEMATGTVRPARKRALIDSANHEYMSAAFNTSTTAQKYRHVGSMKRDMLSGEHTSPMYEVDLGKKGKWHVSAFYDDSTGEFLHHLHSAEETSLARRDTPYPYDSIRWASGGIDWHFCYIGNAPPDGFSDSDDAFYQIAYDQLLCAINGDVDTVGDATNVVLDLYNWSGDVLGELQIVPFQGTKLTTAPGCATIGPPVNQACIVS